MNIFVLLLLLMGANRYNNVIECLFLNNEYYFFSLDSYFKYNTCVLRSFKAVSGEHSVRVSR